MVPYSAINSFVPGSTCPTTWPTTCTIFPMSNSFSMTHTDTEPEQCFDLKTKAKHQKISVTKLIRKALPNRTGYKERKEFWR